jgi:hypothetical protein
MDSEHKQTTLRILRLEFRCTSSIEQMLADGIVTKGPGCSHWLAWDHYVVNCIFRPAWELGALQRVGLGRYFLSCSTSTPDGIFALR